MTLKAEHEFVEKRAVLFSILVRSRNFQVHHSPFELVTSACLICDIQIFPFTLSILPQRPDNGAL